MTKTGVLFIAQNMVIGQHGNTVILLRVQTTDPRQSVANADLKPVRLSRSFSLLRIG